MTELAVDELAYAAREATEMDDFGPDSWQEGLERLVDSAARQARATEIGVEVIKADIVTHLSNRLEVVEWRRTHPEVAEVDIGAPLVIIGQARTGTTILFDLLSQDPDNRAPLTWEVDMPVPPPEPDTYDTDPRIAMTDERLAGTDVLIPGFRAMHDMGARHAQECVRITGGDFRSVIFGTQWRVPDYTRWVLYEADMAPTYRYHRSYLQHLGSRHRSKRWLLKTPGHIWHLEALLAQYPEARLIQTHRDPVATVASISSLISLLRRLVEDAPDITDVAAEWSEYLIDGFDRSVTARESGIVDADRVADVAFTDFMADPVAAVGAAYDQLGLELSAATEAAMADFMARRPRDQHGRHEYDFASTGLDAAEIRERTARYVEYFGVAASESV